MQADGGPVFRRTCNLEIRTYGLGPLPHPAQAEAGRRYGFLGTKPAAVICHLNNNGSLLLSR